MERLIAFSRLWARTQLVSPPAPSLNPAQAVRRVLSGEQVVVSHAGVSQHVTPGEGALASAVAALNCLRVVFDRELEGVCGAALLEELMTRDIAEEIVAICSWWPSDSHQEVDDLCELDFFQSAFRRLETKISQPSLEGFEDVISILQSDLIGNASSAIVITCPLEIIVCLKIVTNSEPVFVIFDSLPRPKHPKGAGFIFDISHICTASYLHNLLVLDNQLADSGEESNGSISAELFVSQAVAHLLDMTQGPTSLDIHQIPIDTRRSKGKTKAVPTAPRRHARKDYVSEDFHLVDEVATTGSSPFWDSRTPQRDFSSHAEPSSFGRNRLVKKEEIWPSPQQLPWNHSFDALRGMNEDLPYIYKQEYHEEDDRHPDVDNDQAYMHQHEGAARYPGKDNYLAYVHQYEGTDSHLRKERKERRRHKQVVFECGICMEQQPIEDIARVERCKHAYCRDCLRQYILSQLADQRFPIVCPICAADKTTRKPRVISHSLIQIIGIPEKEYAKFEELQLLGFALQVSCRKCKKTFLLDKHEFKASKHITCPLPRCRHVWCKSCQQPIVRGGPQHSCDGVNELNHLMQAKGWKHCPGCQTPVQKISGCNHMKCSAPGCGVDFCYACGGHMSGGRRSTQCRCDR